MKYFNRLSICCLLLLLGMPVWAQSLTVTEEFREVPIASVLSLYKNQFGKWEKPDLDEPFPYAVVRVKLEGNAREVKAAKKLVRLDLGRMSGVESIYTDIENELLFLIPSRVRTIYMICGDGCERKLIIEVPKIRPNSIFVGTVHYVPEEETIVALETVKKQIYSFNITPADAHLEIVMDGEKQPWILKDGKVDIELNEGAYFYTVTAENYHTEEGTINVSEEEKSKTITLLPKYGWLTIDSIAAANGDSILLTNTANQRETLWHIPSKQQIIESGTYQLSLKKPRYYDYIDTITILDGEHISIQPNLLVDDRLILKTFIIGEVGYSMVPQFSYGLMFGQTYNGLGWFISGRSDFHTTVPTNGLICDKGGVIDGIMPFYDPSRKTSSATWHAHAGLVIDILELAVKPDHYFDTFGLYLGAGYGVYQHAWMLNNGNWVEYGPTSASGVSATAGVMGSVHGFTIKAGVSTIDFKYMEIEAGIGWMF